MWTLARRRKPSPARGRPTSDRSPKEPLRDRTGLAWSLGLGAALALLVAVTVVSLRRENWNWARPLVEWGVERSTGRTFEIAGDLRVRLGRVTSIEARRIRFGNASWGHSAELADLDHVAFRLRPLAALRRAPFVDRVEAEGVRIALERDSDGRGNWSLRSRADDAPADLPSEIALRDVVVTLTDPRRPQGFRLDLAELTLRSDGTARRLSGRGSYQSEEIAVEATLHGPPRRGGGRTPIVVRAASGATRVWAEGWLWDPLESTCRHASLSIL